MWRRGGGGLPVALGGSRRPPPAHHPFAGGATGIYPPTARKNLGTTANKSPPGQRKLRVAATALGLGRTAGRLRIATPVVRLATGDGSSGTRGWRPREIHNVKRIVLHDLASVGRWRTGGNGIGSRAFEKGLAAQGPFARPVGCLKGSMAFGWLPGL